MTWGVDAPKRAAKRSRSSSEDAMDDSGRLKNQARGTPVSAMRSQLAMTLLSLPATETTSSYDWRKMAGSAAPL